EEGKRFGWSTDKGGGPGGKAPLALGVAPLPMPVGPVALELVGSASAYAGGNALIDVRVEAVVMGATVAQFMQFGVPGDSLIFLPVLPVRSLAMLATLKLGGDATLKAKAHGKVKAGAEASLTALANPLLWPVAGYGRGSLGAEGSIEAEANFETK